MTTPDPAALIHGFLTTRFPDMDAGPEDDIFTLGFVNSLFAMELVMFVESTFGFTVPAEDLRIENFRSVASMVRLVDARTSAQVSEAP